MAEVFLRHLDAAFVVFALLAALLLVLYSAERHIKRLWLMLLVRSRWFPEGRFVLTCATGEPRWDGYMEDVLLPEIGEHAVVVDAERLNDTAGLEHRLVDAFLDGALRPTAVVFLPYLEFRVIDFTGALDTPGEYGDRMLSKTKARLMELVAAQRENMRLYI